MTTRVKDKIYTILDNFFINFPPGATCAVFDNVISDHQTVICNKALIQTHNPSIYEKPFSIYGITNNINLAVETFNNIFVYYFGMNFSTLKFRYNKNPKKSLCIFYQLLRPLYT